MSANKALSYTSNVAKLLKHLDTLRGLQMGIITPVMVHTMPTHRCQLNCLHCCFRNRTDIRLDMDSDLYIEGVRQFHRLGVRAMELTGGGEPTLYPHLTKCLDYFINGLQMKIGIITNGLSLLSVEPFLKDIAWVRISLNTLDYRPIGVVMESVDLALRRSTKISFCYIWNDNSDKNIASVAAVADAYEIDCRVAPDCIMPLKQIDRQMEHIRRRLAKVNSKHLFLSDFNTTLTRRSSRCYMHMIKPALYTDGFIYPCPSAELAMENNKQINLSSQLCHATEVYEFYVKLTAAPLEHSCSFCKYSKQQDLIEDLLAETEFNDFA